MNTLNETIEQALRPLPSKPSPLAFMEAVALSSIGAIRKAEKLSASLDAESHKAWNRGIEGMIEHTKKVEGI